MTTKTTDTILAYKGFDKDLKCRGYEFRLGETFKHEGEVKACGSGFHACEYPLDVFNYYPPATSRFAVVRMAGKLSRKGDDTKVAAAEITIEAEIGIPQIVAKAIEWVVSRCDPATSDKATGYQGAASATGYQGAASATGWGGKARAAAGGAIVLVFRGDDGEIVHIKSAKVGSRGIKADVFYTLTAEGKFVEAA